MAESTSSFAPQLNSTVITVHFIRRRNVLLVRGDLGTLFVDFMLHAADHGLHHGARESGLFKAGLAVFALHCAARPLPEHIAWTLNFQEPRLNLFLVGDNEDGTVTGRIFTEEVRQGEQNLFYSDIVPRRGLQPRRSIVQFDGADAFAAAEAYYAGSEQRLARFFEPGGDEHALLLSHPDCDLDWLRQVDVAAVRQLEETETLVFIDRRGCRWHCGCTQEKIMRVLAQAWHNDAGALFGEDETVRAQCPRCGARHLITREAMEAWLAQNARPSGA